MIATITGGGTTHTGGGSATLTVIDTTLLPVALDFWNDTTEYTPAPVTPLGAVSNPDADALTVSAVGGAAHGAAAVNADGTVTYTPAAGYTGPDSFQYTVTDGSGHTATGTISVTVGPPPTGPADAIDSDLAGIQTDLENPDDSYRSGERQH